MRWLMIIAFLFQVHRAGIHVTVLSHLPELAYNVGLISRELSIIRPAHSGCPDPSSRGTGLRATVGTKCRASQIVADASRARGFEAARQTN
jgi:hypothetical protein